MTIADLAAPEPNAIAMGPFGSNIRSENFVREGVPIIKGANLNGTFLDEDDYDCLTTAKADELRSANVRRLDIVITHRGTLGQVGIVPEDSRHHRYVASQSQLKVTLDRAKVDPYYVYYYLRSPQGQQQLLAHASQVGVPAIAQASTAVKAIVVPRFDPNYERQVVDVLRGLDLKILTNRNIITMHEAIARAIFRSWFIDFDPVRAKMSAKAAGRDPERAAMAAISGKSEADLDTLPAAILTSLRATAALFPDSFQDSALGEIPSGWQASSLAGLCSLNETSWNTRTLPEEVYYIDLANAKNGEISEVQQFTRAHAPSRARRILRAGDTVIGTVRPGNRSFALIPQSDKTLTGSTGFAVLTPRHPELREIVYLHATDDENIERLSHLADGAAYPAVRPDVVVCHPFAMPPRTLLEHFHASAGPLTERSSLARAESRTLATLRETLLPKLMSGELLLPEEADEPSLDDTLLELAPWRDSVIGWLQDPGAVFREMFGDAEAILRRDPATDLDFAEGLVADLISEDYDGMYANIEGEDPFEYIANDLAQFIGNWRIEAQKAGLLGPPGEVTGA